MTGSRLLGSFGKGTPHQEGHAPARGPIAEVCIAKLVDDGTIKFTSKLGAVLRTHFRANPPGEIRAKSITIGQHSPFERQLSWTAPPGLLSTTLLSEPGVGASALGRTRARPSSYHNMNYAVLHFVIGVRE